MIESWRAAGLAFLIFASSASAAEAEKSPVELWRHLIAANSTPEDRERGFSNLMGRRAEMVALIREVLPELFRKQDSSYHSLLHLTILITGEWRIEEIIPILSENIDFKLDKRTFPEGDKFPIYVVFPVALALSKIGGGLVTSELVNIIATTNDERAMRVSLWVLLRIHSRGVLKAVLEDAKLKGHKGESLAKALEILDKVRDGIEDELLSH